MTDEAIKQGFQELKDQGNISHSILPDFPVPSATGFSV